MPIYPKSHYVQPREQLLDAIDGIKAELEEWRTHLEQENKLLEARRLHQRTMFDLEMMKELGYCRGIENYSRHLTGRSPGEPPPTLLDYIPREWMLFVDESHATIPQVRGMYFGDRSRKEILVKYGFRLPSALDNRPSEFHGIRKQAESGDLCLGDSGALRTHQSRGRGRGAACPAYRTHRSAN